MSIGLNRKGQGIEVAGPVASNDEAFFEAMRARFPDKNQRIIDRLGLLENVYVSCGRDKLLREGFDKFLEHFFTKKRGRRKQADIFFLTGQSGAGKSQAIDRLLGEHPVLQPFQASYGLVPVHVSIALTGYTLPRIVAQNIMEKAGYSLAARTGRGEAWNAISDALSTRRVFLVHIDETQHLIKANATTEDIGELADAIKGVSISPTWPVAFVLSGLPRITALAEKDEQFERRGRWVDFPDLDMSMERTLVVRILEELTDAVGLGIGKMAKTDMPERIAHAGRYRYARVCQGVVAAIHHALHDDFGTTVLTRDHFALAYADHSRARGHNEWNPFIVDDWSSLPPGSFLGKDEDDQL